MCLFFSIKKNAVDKDCMRARNARHVALWIVRVDRVRCHHGLHGGTERGAATKVLEPRGTASVVQRRRCSNPGGAASVLRRGSCADVVRRGSGRERAVRAINAERKNRGAARVIRSCTGARRRGKRVQYFLCMGRTSSLVKTVRELRTSSFLIRREYMLMNTSTC